MNIPWWLALLLRRNPKLWAIVTIVTFIWSLANHAKHEVKKRSPELREALDILSPTPTTPKPIPKWRQLVNKGMASLKRKVDMQMEESDSGWNCRTCNEHNEDGDALCVKCTEPQDVSNYTTPDEVRQLLIRNTISKSGRTQLVFTVIGGLLLFWLCVLCERYVWTPGGFALPLAFAVMYTLINSPRGRYQRGFEDPIKIRDAKRKAIQKEMDARQRAQQGSGQQGSPQATVHPAPPTPGTDPSGGATTSQL